MAIFIMIILGIGLTISNTNGWFVVPEFCVWICFGTAAVLAVIDVINYFAVKKHFKDTKRRMDRWMR